MDDHRNLPMPGAGDSDRSDDCEVVAHHDCDPENCEIRRIDSTVAEISRGQVQVAIITAISGVVLSTSCGLTVLSVWAWHAFHGNTMPSVPLFIVSIMMAPFTVGALMMRIPKKVPWRLTAGSDQ